MVVLGIIFAILLFFGAKELIKNNFFQICVLIFIGWWLFDLLIIRNM